MARLVSISYSPWSLRARMALQAMGVSYHTHPYTPTLSEPWLRWQLGRWTGPVTVPVLLREDGPPLTDSLDIARWGSAQADEPLLPPALDAAICGWNDTADALLEAGRLRTTRRVMADPPALAESLPAAVGALGPVGLVVGRHACRRLLAKYGSADSDDAACLARMEASLARIDGALTGDWLLEDRLTYADITVAVALSFVRHARDIADLREALDALGRRTLPVIAKIEKPQAVANIDEILATVEGIMVARGDLGVEIPFEEVPIAQKDLIAAANKAGKLVITATQMLDSMERNPRPTRAEITDVANAILDGTDAVMLSGETATGRYPVEAVQTMDRIARQVEASPWLQEPSLSDLPAGTEAERTVLQAACYAVRAHPRPLVVFTWSGSTAIKSSKSRPSMGIFAITHSQQVADRLALAWGVHSVYIPVIKGTDDLIAEGEKALMAVGALEAGTEVIVLAGQAPMRGATNMMKVEIIDGESSL